MVLVDPKAKARIVPLTVKLCIWPGILIRLQEFQKANMNLRVIQLIKMVYQKKTSI